MQLSTLPPVEGVATDELQANGVAVKTTANDRGLRGHLIVETISRGDSHVRVGEDAVDELEVEVAVYTSVVLQTDDFRSATAARESVPADTRKATSEETLGAEHDTCVTLS